MVTYSLPPPIFQSRCSVEALAHCSPNESLHEQRQAGCHHTACATPYMCWELGKIFSAQGKVGPELFYLASNSKELISPNRKATQALESGLAWAPEPGADFKSIHEALLDRRSRWCLKPTKQTLSNQSILQTAVCCLPGNAETSVVCIDSQVWAACSQERQMNKGRRFLWPFVKEPNRFIVWPGQNGSHFWLYHTCSSKAPVLETQMKKDCLCPPQEFAPLDTCYQGAEKETWPAVRQSIGLSCPDLQSLLYTLHREDLHRHTLSQRKFWSWHLWASYLRCPAFFGSLLSHTL